jgi:hypothetical protein
VKQAGHFADVDWQSLNQRVYLVVFRPEKQTGSKAAPAKTN